MYGVGVTTDGRIAITINGMVSAILSPEDADNFIGLIAHAIEIAQGVDQDNPGNNGEVMH